MITETDKAYLAGLIDGEGCISIARHISKRTPTPIYFLIVAITSCDRDILQYWRDKTNIGSVKNGAKGEGNTRPSFQWWITSNQAISILEMIAPYLMLKREQADIAFQFQNTMNKSWGGKDPNSIKGGKKVNPEIIYQRERYKMALTRMKGYKTKRGRPVKNIPV